MGHLPPKLEWGIVFISTSAEQYREVFVEDAMQRVTARPRILERGDLCSIMARCAWRFMSSVLLIDLVRFC